MPLFWVLILALAGPSAQAADAPILRFREVSPGIYRGARPETAGMEYLAKMGVKVDLNLDNSRAANEQEARDAKRLGIQLISRPMSGFSPPNDAQVDGTLAILADPQNRPIFVHCKHGQDRTGLIIGLHRVFNEQWTPAQAYEEMKELGFHPELVFLKHYYEEKTGYDD